jgi:hypothetical protein
MISGMNYLLDIQIRKKLNIFLENQQQLMVWHYGDELLKHFTI